MPVRDCGRLDRAKKVWDTFILGRLKWYLLVVWIIGWIVPGLVGIIRPSWLPDYLVGTWSISGVRYWIGLSLVGVVLFLFLVAYLRE